ncbi:helix-turn-helix domain-containing protein [Actinomadura monticuli]|uniref:Helix-turn-helix domain-containing protein n=1 Tax=Actinomadura monticuli TaxID=3097367 RepID=A0ABV4QMU2_9ACTN
MDSRAPGAEPPRSVLARGLSLLDAFGSADTELTLTELAARTGLPKPTAHRLLSELVRWGGVERTDRLAPAVRTAARALSRELARESAGELKMGIPR